MNEIPSEYRLIERTADGTAWAYTTRWACSPPGVGMGFRVIRDEWDEKLEVRTIFEIEVVGLSTTGPDDSGTSAVQD